MLDASLKKNIQESYSSLLEAKGWKSRYSQRLMIAEIAKSVGAVEVDGDGVRVSDPSCCVIEAGTGTGKTLAYTMAAIPIAKALGKTVVISTATVALQEQVLYKDLPDIKQNSQLDFDFALAKGRRRYVCVSRLDRLLQVNSQSNNELFGALYPDEMSSSFEAKDHSALAEAMLNALASGSWDGDRECWDAPLEDDEWMPLTVDRNQCTGRRCAFITQCSFYKARERVQQVDCIVANHDLVLSDLALGGGAILSEPEDSIYIFDEAHHLGQKALQHFSSVVRVNSSLQWLEQVQQLSAFLLQHVDLVLTSHVDKQLQLLPSEIAVNLRELEIKLAPFIELLVEDTYSDNAIYLFEEGRVPEDLRDAASALAKQHEQLLAHFENAQAQLEDVSADKQAESRIEWDACWNQVSQHISRAQYHSQLWQAYAQVDESLPWARWLEKRKAGDGEELLLHASPVLAADIMQQQVWKRGFASVLSSATLSSLGSFQRLQLQLGLPESTVYQRLPSAFDTQRVQFNVPDMPCEPNNVEGHTNYMIEHLPELLSRWQGSLVLFSSRRQLQNVYHALDGDLQDSILTQDDYAKIEVIRRHRKAIDAGEQSVIFGLASFAEGVDLPGKYCQHVIIAKIPFSVPGHPLDEALAEWLKQQGKNPFMEISVPDAVQALIQACGRLQRSETDEGEITLLDRRIISKRYGQTILAALPAYKQKIA